MLEKIKMRQEIEVNLDLAENEIFSNGFTYVQSQITDQVRKEMHELKKGKAGRPCIDKEAKEIAVVLSEHKRGNGKEEKIDKGIKKIKKYLKKRNITSFSRNFLNNMLVSYSSISERTKERIVTEVTSKMKSMDVVRTVSFLVNKDIDRIWEKRNVIDTHYYFEEEENV